MRDFRIDDESGDKNYFTMVPNYILNHSGAIEQALYLQMKRYAGEKGSCFASGRTLRKNLKIGQIKYEKALKYLLEHEWIYYKGEHLVETSGGQQMVPVYGIKDLWKLNNEHYNKGVSKSIHLPKVYPETAKGVSRNGQGVSRSVTKKNNNKNNEEEYFFDEKTKTMRPKQI